MRTGQGARYKNRSTSEAKIKELRNKDCSTFSVQCSTFFVQYISNDVQYFYQMPVCVLTGGVEMQGFSLKAFLNTTSHENDIIVHS